MATCIILIDGSNFFFKLKDLGLNRLLAFDFSAFAPSLALGNAVRATRYYVGRIRTDGSAPAQRVFDEQQRFLAHLKKHHVAYSLGYLLKTDSGFHEKGVDVNIAVDMLVAAYTKQCERIILVSSDTDLLPAIKQARAQGVIVEYIGFAHKPSVALVANCSASRLLTKETLAPFVKPALTKTA